MQNSSLYTSTHQQTFFEAYLEQLARSIAPKQFDKHMKDFRVAFFIAMRVVLNTPINLWARAQSVAEEMKDASHESW